jgi:hypothetical protein
LKNTVGQGFKGGKSLSRPQTTTTDSEQLNSEFYDADWRSLDLTPHPAFYKSDEGGTLYIHDTHQGRIREEGDRYALVGRKTSDEHFEELETSNNIEALRDLMPRL